MITYQEAEKIALDKIGKNCALLSKQIIEKPYGWYFNFQSKKHLETGNFSEMLIGSGGFIVERENGQVVEFGSAYSIEKNFEIYEKGFLGSNYDLIILQVKDINQAVRILHKLRMTVVKPEAAYNVEWKNPQTYNEKQLKIALSDLPFTFENQNFYYKFEFFKQIDDCACLEYELRKHK